MPGSLKQIGSHVLAASTRFLIGTVLLVFGAIFFMVPHEILMFLAGGRDPQGPGLSLFFFFWPVAVVITIATLWFDFLGSKKKGDYDRFPRIMRRWKFWIPGPRTTILLVCYFLPIILNGASKVCSMFGLNEVATLAFDWRWLAWPVATMIVVTIGIVWLAQDR